MPPPPPPPGSSGSKVTAIVIAAVVAVAVVVGAIVIGTKDDGGGKETSADAGPSASASDSPRSSPSDAGPSASAAPPGSEDPGQGAPLGGGSDVPDGDPDASDSADPGASESAAPGDRVPYVVLDPGQCFDHPALDSSVTKIEKRSCRSPHDGEVIANETLSGDFSSEKAIQSKALSLCGTDAKNRLKSIPNDGRMYYYYALYPALSTYTVQGEDQVSCALTLSAGPDGKKLSEPLPG
ncbi:hypothetical protein [Streptomyces sp. S465]|uniref:hypothetical protein n=1 Tax=Streptomyces sp. S465 TaxID=2979468 RepID=UPI0022A85719|nr:hypothetical protein [Streptomyces sp. S465]WAP55474.1 hypothetical protein N6H00_11055 [Streptomyces sp. S465]